MFTGSHQSVAYPTLPDRARDLPATQPRAPAWDFLAWADTLTTYLHWPGLKLLTLTSVHGIALIL